MLVQSLAFSDE